jgi:hypothetical protein
MPKISTQVRLFFGVEIRNEDGVQPATLGSALDSFKQAEDYTVPYWCGYRSDDLDDDEAESIIKEVGIELRRLIQKYGKKKELYLLNRSPEKV